MIDDFFVLSSENVFWQGFKNGAFTRPFLEFAMSNGFAQYLYNWLKGSACMEEHWLNTLATLAVVDQGQGYYKVTQRFDPWIKYHLRDNWNSPKYA